MRTRDFGWIVLGLAAALPLAAQDEDMAVLERFQRLMQQKVESTTKTSHTQSQAPGVVTIITAEEIQESGARTLADLLTRIPGVQVGDNRANVLMAWFRGVTTTYNEKVLLVVDGMPKRDATLSEWAPDERIDLANVERIEVIRGPGSAVHGGDAYAAVISIFTRTDLKPSVVQGGGGSQGTAQMGFRTGLSGDGVKAVVSARSFKTDGWATERGLDGTPSDNTNARAAKNLQADLIFREATRLNFVYGDLDYRYPMHIIGSSRDAKYTFTLGSLSHNHTLGGAELHHQLNFDSTKIYFLERVEFPNGNLKQVKEQTKQGTTWGVDSQALWRIGGAQRLLVGLNGERRKATYLEEEWNPGSTNPVHPEHFINSWFSQHGEGPGRNVAAASNYALFGQDEVDLRALRLTLGLRWDHYQGFGGEFSPRLGVVLEPREGTAVKVLWGKAFHPPTFRQLYVVRFDGFQPGDPDLKPEKAVTFEVQGSQTLGQHTHLSLAYFQSTFTDTTVTIADSKWYNSNVPRKVSGLELELRSEFQPDLSWLRSLSLFANGAHLLKAYDETPLGRVDIASVAPATGNAGITLRMPKLTAYTALNYVGRRNAGYAYNPATSTIDYTYHSGVIDPAAKAEDNKGAYLVQDLNLTLSDFCPLPLRLELGAYNLWDRRHYNPTHDPDKYYDVLRERRSLQLKATFKF